MNSSGQLNNDNPFKRHSTLFGFCAAAVIVSLVGWLTNWRQSFMAIYFAVGIASVWFFARIFYGYSSARLLDKALADEGSGRAGWDGRDPDRLVRAYQKAQFGAPSDLEKLAEEEEST